MDGFQVMPMIEASVHGDIFVTATGCKDVITKDSFTRMKDGAILSNAGHFDVEISKPDLDALSNGKREIRLNVEEYQLKDGRRLYLLAEGRLVNLAAGDGHPVEIMDMSFAVQALSLEYVAKNHKSLKPGVYPVPDDIDQRVAQMKLESMGVKIDQLTPAQKAYLDAEA